MKRGARSEPVAIRGVTVATIDIERLEGVLDTLKIAHSGKPRAIKLELYLDWVADFLREREGKDAVWGVCDNCHAPCDPTGTECPVCGIPHEAAENAEGERSEIIGGVKALDESVTRIRSLVQSVEAGVWQIGSELLKNYNAKLYKTRVGKDGKPIHTNWDQFSDAELNLTGRHTRSYMIIAERFTEEQVKHLGVEKLRLIAGASEAVIPELLAKASSMSKREVEEELKKVGVRKPASEDGPKEAQRRLATDAAARKRKTQAEKGQAVTAVFQMGEYDLPLRPRGEELVGMDTLVNGVVITYTVKKVKKKPYLHVKFERKKDEAAE